ncbi:MAG: hypothetical protein Ct9H300mP29_7140 [Candidatus Neomarinimicrobiota bacterium]|nr:MAG: hypothetical protein Ct9H300mP29_7140 [Candidatus Neomarinimicrobiota bacterium]
MQRTRSGRLSYFKKKLYATIDLYFGLTEVYKIVCDPKDDPDALMTVPFEYNGAKQFIAYDKPAPVRTGCFEDGVAEFH